MDATYKGPDTGHHTRFIKSYRYRSFSHRNNVKAGWRLRIYKGPAGMTRVITNPYNYQRLGDAVVDQVCAAA